MHSLYACQGRVDDDGGWRDSYPKRTASPSACTTSSPLSFTLTALTASPPQSSELPHSLMILASTSARLSAFTLVIAVLVSTSSGKRLGSAESQLPSCASDCVSASESECVWVGTIVDSSRRCLC